MTDTLTPAERTALARIREGWVLVPREPTEAILNALMGSIPVSGPDWYSEYDEAPECYRAMLAAVQET